MSIRITIRFNAKEEAELKLLKERFHIENDSQAIKVAISWVINYLSNVSKIFFPEDYDVALIKKRKTVGSKRLVY